jgi:hypothetical protein
MQQKLLMNGWPGEPFFFAVAVLDFSYYFFASRTRMYITYRFHKYMSVQSSNGYNIQPIFDVSTWHIIDGDFSKTSSLVCHQRRLTGPSP